MLCAPALVFVLFMVFSYAYALLHNKTFDNGFVAGAIIAALIWIFVIRYACMAGYNLVAWTIAVGPFVVNVFLGAYCACKA